ncbi:TerD family protein [Actinomyces oris]|uniref:TerD family protein n=1 Tax=Actinomyces oris TaxID=544580 RepID=A0A508BCU1_9ACTO|nr:TerD family protein [Actinomyces oris]QQC39150.1 TerD family protein [Actinomyces oris]TQD59639.1 TerD family protein [Actinomyces oris]
MGVNQSSATTAVDTEAGAAVGGVPGTYATAELNAVTIRRLEAVYIPPAGGRPAPSSSASPQEAQPTPQRSSDAGVDAALTTLRSLGYRLSAPAREELTHPEQAWALVNAAARLSSGSASAEYRPFYPDFPVQVRTASEATLLVNAALHYLGDVVGVRILPDYRPSPREPLPGDDGALTELGLATAQDLERIVADLIAQATPFSAQDRADLTALRDFGPEAAPRVAVKENLAVLTVTFPDLDFSASYRTVTDVLRLAVAMAGGDVSLAEPCRFPSFSRAQRRRLLGLLDAVGQVQDSRDSAEEMARRCERWKRLARHLRPGDYARRFPRAAALLHQVASGDAEAGFTSRLEEALARRDVEGALRLLSTRPGVFARRLNHLLRLCVDEAARERVVAEFARAAPVVSLPVLVRLWEYFSSPGPDALPWRVVAIKAATGTKTALIPSTRRPGPADAAVVRAVEEALRQRKRLGRIAVDQGMYEGYTAPVGLHSASPGVRTAGRGTRLPLPEGETIRFFLHWRDLPEAPPKAPRPAGPAAAEDRDTRVDLDLSAFFVSEDFTRTEQIAYYNLRSTAAVHSGDLTSAPDGAAEFIDVTLAEALRQEWRYVVMTVHSFSHHRLSEVPKCWAGAMARGADPQSGEIFEASTVMQRLDLVSPTFNATPFVIDLAERQLIWWDLPVGVGEHQVANLDRSSNRVLAHLLDLLEGRRMPLAHLLGLLADDVVEDPDEAELVFGEGGILPWQTEQILALLGPAEAAVEELSDVNGGAESQQAG